MIGSRRRALGAAVALVALGIWVAAAPGSVPDLTQPGSNPAMKMEPDKMSTDKMSTDKMMP